MGKFGSGNSAAGIENQEEGDMIKRKKNAAGSN